MALTGGTFGINASGAITAATIDPQGTASPSGLESPSADAQGTGSQTLSYGTSSGAADILCAGDFTLAAAGTVEWDLFTGTDFKDVFGQTAAFRKLRGLFIAITDGGDTAGVTIGDAATDPNPLFFGAVDQTWTIFPDGPPMMGGSPAGVAVAGATSNLLITNNGAVEVTVRVMLAGTSV